MALPWVKKKRKERKKDGCRPLTTSNALCIFESTVFLYFCYRTIAYLFQQQLVSGEFDSKIMARTHR